MGTIGKVVATTLVVGGILFIAIQEYEAWERKKYAGLAEAALQATKEERERRAQVYWDKPVGALKDKCDELHKQPPQPNAHVSSEPGAEEVCAIARKRIAPHTERYYQLERTYSGWHLAPSVHAQLKRDCDEHRLRGGQNTDIAMELTCWDFWNGRTW